MSMEELSKRLGYSFRSPRLLTEALTHPSQSHEQKRQSPHNQRLEFLGDAVLQLVITEWLFERFPDWPEGRLTALRAQLVNWQQLKVLAESLGVGPELIMGRGEERTGGRERESNLADAMEAIIGAIHLDAGWAASREVVRRLWGPAIDAAGEPGGHANPKGDLQERLQVDGAPAPEYECLGEDGPAHSRSYEVRVLWKGEELGRGKGPSKKDAETAAARVALGKLGGGEEKEVRS